MPSPWPMTTDELRERGYSAREWGQCRDCGARVLWAVPPSMKPMPMVEVHPPIGADDSKRYFQSHFADCPNAANRRKKKTA